MPYCPKCKVALAPGTIFCPLCRSHSVESLNDTGEEIPERKNPTGYGILSGGDDDSNEQDSFSPREKRLMVFELLSVSFGIALVATLCIDFFHSGSLSWSCYTSLILVISWLCSAIPLILWSHRWLIFAVLGPSPFLCVFLWGVFSGNLSWVLVPGFTITAAFEIALISVLVLVLTEKRKGLNTIGIILAGIAFVCASIDASIMVYVHGKIYLSWSLIVLLSSIPVSGFFFYLHYRIMKRVSLRKLFRL